LFDRLGATDEQLDFPIVYTSALMGYATLDPNVLTDNMEPLFETIVKNVPAPKVEPNGTFQMQISTLDYSSYVGMIGIGRVTRGQAKTGSRWSTVVRSGKHYCYHGY
jgi:GTP-binding protein